MYGKLMDPNRKILVIFDTETQKIFKNYEGKWFYFRPKVIADRVKMMNDYWTGNKNRYVVKTMTLSEV